MPLHQYGALKVAIVSLGAVAWVVETVAFKVDAQTIVLTVLALTTAYNSIAGKSRDKALRRIEKTGDEIHILSNSNMAAALKVNVVSLRAAAVALRTVSTMANTPGNIAAADAADIQVKEAESILANHLNQQAKIDTGKKNT